MDVLRVKKSLKLSNPFKRIRQVSQTMAMVDVNRAKTRSELIGIALSAVKGSLSMRGEVNRIQIDRAMSGFSKAEIDRTIDYLCEHRILYYDKARERVGANDIIWNCCNCSNYILGDGWHLKQGCRTGKSLQISRSNEGRFCPSWHCKGLSKELSAGWVED